MYLTFAEALERFARDYGIGSIGTLLLDLEGYILDILRHKAIEGFRSTSGLDICFEEGPACDIIVLDGRGSYRLFNTERVYVRAQEGFYVEEYLLRYPE